MGDLASTIGTAADIASDPYLQEVICRIGQLKQIDRSETVGLCVQTAPGEPGGIGLRNAVPVLRGYVYAQQNKWVYPLAVAVILGIPLWVGYQLGRGHL
jgi:hypothetical protein